LGLWGLIADPIMTEFGMQNLASFLFRVLSRQISARSVYSIEAAGWLYVEVMKMKPKNLTEFDFNLEIIP